MRYDVVIIGYGPTGKILARLLTDAGHSVAIIERWPAAYPLPRAVGYDHEIERMFQALGVAGEVGQISRPMNHYVWYNADWKVLIDIDETRKSVSGGRTGYLFNQPDLERVLERDLVGRPGVTLYLSREAQAVESAAEGALVTIAPFDEETRVADVAQASVLTGKYVVGCDGANSLVRKAIGSSFHDHGFDAHWLVVDVRPRDLSSLPIPDAAQWCNPKRPTTVVPSGVANRRWEFMIKPGEDVHAFSSAEKAWELLTPWIKPSEGELVRHAVYRFRSLLARGWRNGRLLIAGDAAHLMPPFMGQGMCSGLRDSWNLAWKLDRVLKGLSSERLLDEYEVERGLHVDGLIRLSMDMGKVVCVSDADAARARDEAFFNGRLPPPPAFPGLTGGVIGEGAGAGLLTPHDELLTHEEPRRLDEVVGRRFAIIGDAAVLDGVDAEARAAAARLDLVFVPLGDSAYRERDGRISAWLATHEAKTMITRPDFYAYGLARDASDASRQLKALASRLAA